MKALLRKFVIALALTLLATNANAQTWGSPQYSGVSKFLGGTLTLQLLLPDGTLAAPALAFASAPSTGITLSTPGQIHFSVAGTDRGYVSSVGVVAGAFGIGFANSYLQSPSSGVVTFTDNADTSFGRLVFGPATSSFPALKRNGASVQFVLGDGTVTGSGITGTTTNNNATAGDYGEYIEASVGFGTVGTWSTGVSKNITSAALTAGDWDVTAHNQWQGGAITGTSSSCSISTTSATPDTNNQTVSTTMSTASSAVSYVVPTVRLSLSGNSTAYLVCTITFSGGTPTAGGKIRARRVR